MSERQQKRRPRYRTCTDCGLRWVWPDAFPIVDRAVCVGCVERHRKAVAESPITYPCGYPWSDASTDADTDGNIGSPEARSDG